MSVIRVPKSVDLSTSTRDSVSTYTQADTLRMGYFNFMALPALVLHTTVQALRDTELVPRIRQGFEGTPFLDALPIQFRDQLASLDKQQSNQLAADWFYAESWGHAYEWWEERLPAIVESIVKLAKEAKQSDEELYFLQ